jgi:hypothetical protein
VFSHGCVESQEEEEELKEEEDDEWRVFVPK